MIDTNKDRDSTYDRVRHVVSRTEKLLKYPSESEARAIVEDCDRLTPLILSSIQAKYHSRQTKYQSILALLDIAISGISANSILGDMNAVFHSGLQLSAAITAIRVHTNASGFKIELELELGALIGVRLDEALYATAMIDKPCSVGWLCDTLLSGGYGGRQIVETSDEKDRKTWLRAVARTRNSSENFSHTEPEPTLKEAPQFFHTAAKQILSSISALSKASTFTKAYRAAGTDDNLRWNILVEGARKADTFKKLSQRWLFINSTSCTTPYTAKLTGKDIIYLIAGTRGSVAVRFHGGEHYYIKPEVLHLPDINIAIVKSIKKTINDLFDSELGREEELETFHKIYSRLGKLIFEPITKNWLNLKSLALIPVGIMQGLPYLSSLVGDSRLGDILDVTIGPTAKTLLLSNSHQPEVLSPTAVIIGDPSEGVNEIEQVTNEVPKIGKIYSDRKASFITLLLDKSNTHKPKSDEIFHLISSGDVVHLACHGVDQNLDNKIPLLVIGEAIPFSEFQTHRLKPGARVVLSACSVAKDSSLTPFSHLGFPTMLLSAGASSVIASLWPVPDSEETVDFMLDIHHYLSEGYTGSEALRFAVREAIAKDIPPSVWSAFESFGC